MPEHGKQETLEKDQTMTSANDGSVLCSLFGIMSVNEMEPLQNLNGPNEFLELGRSKDIHEPEQHLKRQDDSFSRMSTEAFPHLRIVLANGSLTPYKPLGAAVSVEVMNVSLRGGSCEGML
ncbi:hypothetical protein Sjap_018255 [Stephania japonica]|uniref:Uncharacterized protein n=1 Tax=Stephania japonica TaxID=461633 RepID=A0AAP0I7Q1_9MAGN